MRALIPAMEKGWVPDALLKRGIRRLLEERLRDTSPETKQAFLSTLKTGPIAVATDVANKQHYEVPSDFFLKVLGPRLKYSSCYYQTETDSLTVAEDTMLGMTCERAELLDGQHILELGCGWGSLSLWMATHYPGARITSISNSHSQAEFIRGRAAELGVENLTVVTSDINDFSTSVDTYDRIVSVEMFEHMRNWDELTRRVAGWLKPNGKAFVHIFTHREVAYPFESDRKNEWMARYFFTGGIMPSHDIFQHFDHLAVEKDWVVNGTHYGKTLYAWLDLQDQNKAELMPLFRKVYGKEAAVWWQRWRVFWMACGELFNYKNGTEWQVSHFRLVPKS